MRTYPTNSPEAAGRVLALLLIADGHVCATEMEALAQHGAEARLGLPHGGLNALLRDLCEDLLAAGPAFGPVGDDVLDATMREITSVALQDKLLRLIHAAARADAHLADGEAAFIASARRVWAGTQPAVPAREEAITP